MIGPQNYESTTHYDIPRTPSLTAPNIPDHETVTDDTNTECKIKLDDDAEVIVTVKIEETNKDGPSLEEVVTGPNLIDEIITEANNNDTVPTAITGKTAEAPSGDGLTVNIDLDGSESAIKTDRHTPTIVVTDTDSPTGRHSYVEIRTEHNFGEDCDFNSGLNQVIESGHLVDEDEEVISDRKPLLQRVHDQYPREADVSDDRRKQKTILVTDLDSDITQEVRNFEFSEEFSERALSDFTDSQGESVLPDLTISHCESTASNVTVITKEESLISGESLLPDLLISEEENLSSQSSQKEGGEIVMGNQSASVEKVYTFDNPPASGPYPSNPAGAYRQDEPTEEIIIGNLSHFNCVIILYTEDLHIFNI